MKKLATLVLGLTLICANDGYTMYDSSEEYSDETMMTTPSIQKSLATPEQQVLDECRSSAEELLCLFSCGIPWLFVKICSND